MTYVVKRYMEDRVDYLWSPKEDGRDSVWNPDQKGAWRFQDRVEAYRQATYESQWCGRMVRIMKLVRRPPQTAFLDVMRHMIR